MKTNPGDILVIPLAIAFVATLLWSEHAARVELPDERVTTPPRPNFAAFKNVREKKAAFFNFMLPKVRQANRDIASERRRVERLLEQADSGNTLAEADHEWLQATTVRYRVKGDPLTDANARSRLLRKVDVIPESLALAQAANESAWGTARFAREGNNFFGIWCWTENCGIVPKEREAGATHKVTRFQNVDRSVRYYLLTLNSHPAYSRLREIREQRRKQQLPLTGHDLAAGLLAYSERREAYVKEIREMISFNRLQRFTQPDHI